MSEQDTPIAGTIPAGTSIRIRFSYYSILYVTRLAEGDILSTCNQSATNWQASLVSYDVTSGVGLSESGSIYATMLNPDDTNNVINEARNAFRTFNSIVGANISEVDQVSQVAGPLSSLLPNLSLTTSALAIIAIVVLIILFKSKII